MITLLTKVKKSMLGDTRSQFNPLAKAGDALEYNLLYLLERNKYYT